MGSSPRLRLEQLGRLPIHARPRVDPRQLPIGIVHLGPGAFHRAHQAIFTEDAIAASGDLRWGICGVSQTSPRVLEALVAQDGLYSVCARDGAGSSLRVVGTLRELLWARRDGSAVIARLAEAAVEVVTVTVTEKGYRRAPDGRLDAGDPDVAADLADGGTRTILGQLTAGLGARRRAGLGGLTVVSCDNLSGNGPILRDLVLAFAQRRHGDALAGWIADRIAFPATMVDRIVPAADDAVRAAAADALGLADAGALLTEPFAQWVIEDRFVAGRPAWERAGAILTGDVTPYERVKLGMLNATHSLLAYLGALGGCELIADVLDPALPFAEAARALQREDVAPAIAPPPEVDLGAYGEQVLHRFANPALPYRVLQVAGDGSQKLPQRLLGTAAARRAAGAEPRWVALAVGAWMRVMSAGVDDRGRRLAVADPLQGTIAAALAGATDPAPVVDRLLGLDAVFDPPLAEDPVWRGLLIDALGRLATDGAEAAVRELTESASPRSPGR
jgi:fructuronate reductase